MPSVDAVDAIVRQLAQEWRGGGGSGAQSSVDAPPAEADDQELGTSGWQSEASRHYRPAVKQASQEETLAAAAHFWLHRGARGAMYRRHDPVRAALAAAAMDTSSSISPSRGFTLPEWSVIRRNDDRQHQRRRGIKREVDAATAARRRGDALQADARPVERVVAMPAAPQGCKPLLSACDIAHAWEEADAGVGVVSQTNNL
eukprot:COSAG01_NODE_14278_length_1473_cov_3.639738_2_plen_201_part_00